nr:TIGR04283 family arsenosugar biosynthesis glycosyltransferase [Membranihabitans maritimus]
MVSIIIPVLNEEEGIADQLKYLMAHGKEAEIILVDGGSDDSTVAIAQDFPVKIYSSGKGRAAQMNLGAQKASRDILYFLHADAKPPETFIEDIYSSLLQGFDAGCFKMDFQDGPVLMKLNGFLSKFNMGWTGGGDQSLFLFKSVFEEIGGFDENFTIMEDFDIVDRLKNYGKFQVINNDIKVSTRKYNQNSYLKVQCANILVYNMYRLGYSQEQLTNTYQRMLNDIRH